MNNSNKTYRIKTKVGVGNENINLNLNLLQKYDILEILSLKLSTDNVYKTHTSGYGCVVGRVLANGGIGVPNAKISIFIEANENTTTDEVLYYLYPYKTTRDKNSDFIRYNLLPDEKVSDCHQIIGTFPSKRLVLDDKNVLEIFENYYKFTTVTNESGDYMLFGVPTGNQTVHMDLDLSDIGFLSQKPTDLKYKGYNINMFENPQQFKTDTNIDNLAQVMTQSSTIYVKPFWGENDGEELGITRHDIDVNYKFEPTCIFIGSVVSDSRNDGFSKKCIPSRNMGRMEKLTTGHGTIEMIRKKSDGSVEEYSIMGNELIDENGTWSYQIPMNLDYIITDEYGNLVPSDNPEKGLPTRTRVRFRVSLNEFESENNNNHLAKILIPNNPQNPNNIDYVYGTNTKDNEDGSESFRDLFWNNVYTVKSHIPRIQRGNNQRTEKFSGIKNVNINEGNNPIPYNNMRVNITFMFTLQCAIIKSLIFFIKVYNLLIGYSIFKRKQRVCAYIGDGLCPDLEGWYFAPMCGQRSTDDNVNDGWREQQRTNTLKEITNKEGGNSGIVDEKSIDGENKEDDKICLTTKIDYFMQCLEINLALENNVIQFDFYNDWINGLIYIPRWYVNIRKKASFLFGLVKVKPKIQACLEDSFNKQRRYVQQCALGYQKNNDGLYTFIGSENGCSSTNKKQKCHKTSGRKYVNIFGKKGGIVHEETTLKKQSVFYLKPCETISNGKKCNLFATDIVLLGSINKCNIFGVPSDFSGILSSTYQMPPALVQTNMDSDGALYGMGNGVNKCNNKATVSGVTPIEQNFKAYETWSSNKEDNTDITEYAVTELSGIDWGISGPNQGKNDFENLYYPGGHFLGISCNNAQVNIKSCVNLSRICEIGTIISQRQAKYSISENEFKIKYILPTGFISKDEIGDNNFRNIFATLNYNKLKTQTNEYGLKEYKFIPLQPINFGGDLKNKVNNKYYNSGKLNDNTENNSMENADAYRRTIEENSKDYTLFRFGIDNENKKNHINNFLINENQKCFLPVYENSFYFYYGLKNGATALDKFLSEYYAQCSNSGEIKEPEFIVDVYEKEICSGEKNKIVVRVKNVPNPLICRLRSGDTKPIEKYNLNEFIFEDIDEGEYIVEIENKVKELFISKNISVKYKLPTNDSFNFYEGSCSIDGINFNVKPKIVFNENRFEVTPNDNGGIIILTLPKIDREKKGPYIYGFGLTNNNKCVCYTTNVNKFGADNSLLRKLNESLNREYTPLNMKFDKVENIEELYNVSETNSKYMVSEDGMMTFAIKGWDYNANYEFYICYTCSKGLTTDDLRLHFIDSYNLNINHNKMSYYLYDSDIALSDIDISSESEIIEINNTGETPIAVINYNNISSLTPYEEWAIKRALYFDNSFYTGDGGSINLDITGGTLPYTKKIVGTSEFIVNGKIILIDVDSTKDGDTYPIDINFFYIPTKKWLDEFENEDGEVYNKNPYKVTIIDDKGVVPHIFTKLPKIK